eukprot:TRINITY_DN14184_c0_g1_i1.p1 TRINITY_DN14184_c0_g1~~TRINITY_DN14184_c0_g1_i1.p1  ORF type:complete len:149 (-),score=40.36 TRINITY_DN14184_c0_g1_i1:71-517(-)
MNVAPHINSRKLTESEELNKKLEECVSLGRCTITINQKGPIEQSCWKCIECSLVICSTCSIHCHKHHEKKKMERAKITCPCGKRGIESRKKELEENSKQSNSKNNAQIAPSNTINKVTTPSKFIVLSLGVQKAFQTNENIVKKDLNSK